MRWMVMCSCVLFGALSGWTQESGIETGFRSMFDGKSLEGWEGRSDLWSVQDGAITGITTADKPLKGNTFLIWKGGEPSNFELRAKFKIEGGNSGIQYRSKVVNQADYVVGGYQADIDAALNYAGILYEEKGRGILALRGQKVTVHDDGTKTVEAFGDAKEVGKVIKNGEWNDYRVVAQGNHLQHFINGQLMSEVIDEQPSKGATKGIIALQIHTGPPMKIQYQQIQIKDL